MENQNVYAFPFTEKQTDYQHGTPVEYETVSPGMTLRDYLAAKAMQGTFGNPEAMEMLSKGGSGIEESFKLIAERSYKMADAMLKARTT